LKFPTAVTHVGVQSSIGSRAETRGITDEFSGPPLSVKSQQITGGGSAATWVRRD
jgi:hypothetical protein